MKIVNLVFIFIVLITLTSCATISTVKVAHPPTLPVPEQIIRQDVIHVVAPGETLWRLGKTYDVKIDDIIQVNKLGDSNTLEMGQELLIPKAKPPIPVITLYPSNKWKYIIIHHSASDEGNALSFHKSHIYYRGFSKGLGYHFVIDNGTSGKPDGYIEISPRWIKQEDGAHCKASGMNYKGIGICLVGNFSKENVSDKQLTSLVYLVNVLKDYYKISSKNILGHGQVPGANTECPGKKFPWKSFNKQLYPVRDRQPLGKRK